MSDKIIVIVVGICSIAWMVVHAPQCPAEPRLVIIGDSISAGSDSWPTHLQGYYPHILAQGGRLAREYAPPRDIRVTNGDNKAVYFLSTGDILHNADAKETRKYISAHVQLLTSRGFEVTLVTPPIFGIPKYNKVNRQHRRMINRIPNVSHCDLAYMWDKDKTWDSVHPVPELSERIAWEIQECME